MYEGGCLKISYRKQLGSINYESSNRYEEIIKLIIQHFKIPASHERALLISTENGRIFDKQLFDYFLTLFPNPSIIFYIRYDYNRAICLLQPIQQQEEAEIREATTTASIDIGMEESKKKQRTNDAVNEDDNDNDAEVDDECSNKFTPVFRMNCFIYEYPTTTNRLKRSSDSANKTKKSGIEKQSPRSEFVKRVKRHLQLGELKKHTRKPLAQVKRIMRL